MQKIATLPQDEQDAIASQILTWLADEEGRMKRFAEKARNDSPDGSGSDGGQQKW